MCAKATSRAQASAQAQEPQEQPQSIPEQPQPPQVPATVLLLQKMVAQLEQLNENLKPLIGLVPEFGTLILTVGDIRDVLLDRTLYQTDEGEVASILSKSSYEQQGDEEDEDALEHLDVTDYEEDETSADLEPPQLPRRAAQSAPPTQEHDSLPWGIRPLDLPKTAQRTRESWRNA